MSTKTCTICGNPAYHVSPRGAHFRCEALNSDEANKDPSEKPVSLRPDHRKRNWLITGAVVLAAWAWTGFMGPGTMLNGIVAADECIRFAKEREVFKYGDFKVSDARNLRIRHSSWVVDVFAVGPDKKALESRTCVVDGDTIKITSMLENWYWR